MLTIVDPLLIIIALVICITGFVKRSRLWMMGKKGDPIENTCQRIKDLIVNGPGHSRILNDIYPGLMHFFIFFACVIPFIIILCSQSNWILPEFIAIMLSVFLDILGLLGLAAVIFAAFRRYIQKPDRLSDSKNEDLIALVWIFSIIFLGFCIAGLRIRITGADTLASPVGTVFSYIFIPFSTHFQASIHSFLWRTHFFLVLILIATLPYTKFIHLITSSANIFLKNYSSPGSFKGIDFETAESYGVANIEEFTRTQLLNLDACIRCGRCQDNCPAYLSDKPLSPKKLLQDLKDHMVQKTSNSDSRNLIGDVIEHETLWACTMCLSCHTQCPILDTTVDKTIELRRYLVMTEPNFPSEVQAVFKNMENNSNPWGVGAHTRGDWAKDLEVKTASDGDDFDILFYLGCAGAFDDRYKKVAVAITKILQKAGIKFAILGPEEGCCGDSARRLGNEYLFETLAQTNVATMQNYKVKKILTICPHCFNTLKNDYPAYGGEFEVIHHSVFLMDLIQNGKIHLKPSEKMSVCYHDSCFLGRYNDIYDEPRNVLNSISGITIKEMERNMDRSFCCGAGGGRMWMEEDIGKRINEMRTDQALEKQPDAIATACPYCLTMIDDGLKVREKSDSVKSMDIAEFILNAME